MKKNYLVFVLIIVIIVALLAALFIFPKSSSVVPDLSLETEKVELYYYNPQMDMDETGNIMCSSKGLVAVERDAIVTETPISSTISLLLEGKITDEEKRMGITSEFPLDGLSLSDESLLDGVLTLTFSDKNNKTSGGSCRAGILWSQIEATAKQFPDVESVRFLPEDVFQP
jgi:spore germination protein GerM